MSRDPLAEIALLERQPKGLCSFGIAVENLDEALRPGVIKAVDAKSGLTAAAISRWLASEGVPTSEKTIMRHRKGICACS